MIADEAVELGSIPKIGNIEQDLLRELTLVQRYDRHFSKEMFGALALLLVLRRSGEAGLEDALTKIFGIRGVAT